MSQELWDGSQDNAQKQNILVINKEKGQDNKGYQSFENEDDQADDFSKQEMRFIGNKHQAPDWMIDNKYILTGYRINYSDWVSIFESLLECHNETFNVWSHLLGVLLLLLAVILVLVFWGAGSLPCWPIIVFLFSAICCQFFSALYHLSCCKNKEFAKKIIRLDFAGINILIAGSGFPLYYYAFYCQIHLAYIYLSLNGVICVIVFIINLQDFIYDVKYHKLRNFLFVISGCAAALPTIHVIAIHLQNPSPYSPYNTLIIYAIMGAFYIAGVFVMNSRQPEKSFPYKFDVCCQSHNIWHIMVSIAILITFFGSMQNYHSRLKFLC